MRVVNLDSTVRGNQSPEASAARTSSRSSQHRSMPHRACRVYSVLGVVGLLLLAGAATAQAPAPSPAEPEPVPAESPTVDPAAAAPAAEEAAPDAAASAEPGGA